MLNLVRACRRRHSHRRVIVAKPLDRLGAGWYGPLGLRVFCGLRGLHSLFGERWSRGRERKGRPAGRRDVSAGTAKLELARRLQYIL